MTKLPTHVMTVADVARVLGVGPDRVRQLDGELRPVRLDTAGSPRRYDPSIVERVLRDRSK
jgi:hypothetical protein